MKATYGLVIMLPREWEPIKQDLIERYGPSIMISWKCKRELGFTVRNHKGLVKYGQDEEWTKFCDDEYLEEMKNRYHYQDQVHLDFYSESAKTMFLLKYTGFSNQS